MKTDLPVAILKTGSSCELANLSWGHWYPLAISFFGDVELALLLKTYEGERYLVTIEYTSLPFTPVETISNESDLKEALTRLVSLP